MAMNNRAILSEILLLSASGKKPMRLSAIARKISGIGFTGIFREEMYQLFLS